jgi:7-keto-8-aminopelargonate synthetase-like enzyme
MDLFHKCQRFEAMLQVARAQNRFFYSRAIAPAASPVVRRKGRELINLGSSNYLGLTQHPAVKAAAIQAIRKYGTGSAGSRLLTGTSPAHLELEQQPAGFKGTEADEKARRAAGRLEQKGVFANPVVFPAVLTGRSIIRISLMATHTEEQLSIAADRFTKVGTELGVI